jgi:hypothetical protein
VEDHRKEERRLLLQAGRGKLPRATFAEALKDAEKYTGKPPNILALPRTFRTAGVHLMMKEG